VTESAQPPRVFISYSHDSPEHKNKVLNLSDQLRRDGIDCRLDQYEQAPPEGWPRWTEKEIRDASYVLMICTESYYRRVRGEENPSIGHGVRWEGNAIYQDLYNAGTVNAKFVPVLLKPGDEKHIPIPVQGVPRYHIYAEQGYEDLYRRLTNQPSTLKPALGKPRSLPPKKRQAEFGETPPSPDKPTAIKGLRAFRRSDQAVFARLQRVRDLDRCLAAILDSEFRFGILSGESGCGKSSFLQAGLLPRLEQGSQPHTGVYAKFSNEDPIQSVRTALVRDLGLLKEKIQNADLVTVLEAGASAVSRPIVLVLDQFEQFFVHRKLKQDREPFVHSMAVWYRGTALLPVKVLVSVRGDFSDRLVELQQAMGYSIGPGQNFRLEKFAPQEAAEIMRIIAELERLPFDAPFVERMVREELASREDSLISPVDLQVLAWVIKGQKTEDKRAFTGKAFEKIGGIEGLLERFLTDTLAARHGEASKQAVLQVLLGLIDLERNTRAGSMTIEQLQDKLKGTLATEHVVEAVQWLAREDIRLVTSLERDETVSYEVAHERLIPAVRKVAGKQLSEGNRANELLDRRVNEWLGNERRSRYLLGWREWRLIEKQKPYITWGPKRGHKEELLRKTKQRWAGYAWAAASVLSVMVLAVATLLSPWGQIQLVKWDIAKLSRGNDPRTLSVLAIGLSSAGYPLQAAEVAARIDNPYWKADALGAVAQATARAGDPSKAAELLRQAAKVAAGLDRALRAVAQATAQVASATKNTELLKQAEEMAARIDNPFEQARALSEVARAAAQARDADKNAELLRQAAEVAAGIYDSLERAHALSAVAQVMAQVASATKNTELLRQAAEVAAGVSDPWDKAWALGAVAQATARAGDLSKAAELLRQVAEMATGLNSAWDEAHVLGEVAQATAQVASATKNTELLRQAAEVATRIRSWNKAKELRAVVQATAQVASATKNAELLRQAAEVATRIDDRRDKAQLLRAVAQATAQLGYWGRARDYAAQNVADEGRAEALVAILMVWYGVENEADTVIKWWSGE
jgi:hypothetical protein